VRVEIAAEVGIDSPSAANVRTAGVEAARNFPGWTVSARLICWYCPGLLRSETLHLVAEWRASFESLLASYDRSVAGAAQASIE
jgi:hypothetical protein